MTTDAQVVPGRECGTCSLCCKVFTIEELNKPPGVWCKHAKPGKGCVIYDSRPNSCAVFNCRWRTEEAMPAHWKPDVAKMVVTVSPRNGYIYVRVDPGAPSAWRRQPYYDQLRQLAKENLDKEIYVIVQVNQLATLILPEQDVELGSVKIDRISLTRNFGPNFAKYQVTVT